jgi:hypothetical protein
MKILWKRFFAWLKEFLFMDEPENPNEYHTMDGDK